MIDQQMDIYAVYKDYKTKEYKRFNDGKLVAHKLGTIYPAGGQYGYPTAPNISLDLEPKKSADIIILPKGVKPGEEMQQGGSQNNYQNQSNHISNSMPNTQQGDPGPSGHNNY